MLSPSARIKIGSMRFFAFWLLSPLLAAVAFADGGVDVRAAWFEERADGHTANADLDFSLSPDAARALRADVALPFLLEIQIVAKRDFWFDKTLGEITWNPSLEYDSLLGRYRLKTPGSAREFDDLAALTAAAGSLRGPPFRDEKFAAAIADERAYVRARLSLEVERLPPPLQIELAAGDEWRHDSGWRSFALTMRVDGAAE